MANWNLSNVNPKFSIIKMFNHKDYTSLKFIKE
jgi:hypothetical protein